MGYPLDEVVLHAVFPPVTGFKVAFENPTVRENFNNGLSRLCSDGTYARLLPEYGVVLQNNICD